MFPIPNYFCFSIIAASILAAESNLLGWPKATKEQILQKLQNDLLNKKGYFDRIFIGAEAEIAEFNAQIDAASKSAKEDSKKKITKKAKNCVNLRVKLINELKNFNFDKKFDMEKIKKMSGNFKKFIVPIMAKPKEFVPFDTTWSEEFVNMQNYFENFLKPLKIMSSAWQNVEEAEKEHKNDWAEFHKFDETLKEKKEEFREMKINEMEISRQFSDAIKCAGDLSDLNLAKFKIGELEEEINRKLGKCKEELKMVNEKIKKLKNMELDKKGKKNMEMRKNASGLQIVGNVTKNFFQKIYSNNKNAHQQPVWMGEAVQNALATMDEVLKLIREQFLGQPTKMSEAELKGMNEAKMHGNQKLRQHVKQLKNSF